MSKRLSAAALCVLTALVLAAPAHARAPRNAVNLGNSFIDKDHQGDFDPGVDKKLADLVPAGSVVTYSAPAGDTVVLDGVRLSKNGWLDLTGSVDVRVRGTLANSLGYLYVNAPDITFERGATVQAAGDATEFTAARQLTFGENVQVSVTGDNYGISFRGANVSIGSGTKFAPGNGYNDVFIFATAGTVTFAPNVSAIGAAHGSVEVSWTDGDVVVPKFTAKLGYLIFKSAQRPGAPANRVQFFDSTITQTYQNGELWLKPRADAQNRFAKDAVLFNNTIVTTKTLSPVFIPMPVCENGAKHVPASGDTDACTYR